MDFRRALNELTGRALQDLLERVLDSSETDAIRLMGSVPVGYWLLTPGPASGDLSWPGDQVDPSWLPFGSPAKPRSEREVVLRHLDSGEKWRQYLGYSPCRLCALGCNGTSDRTDGTYVWPEGYSHYVRDHGVKPPREFIDHVLKGRKP